MEEAGTAVTSDFHTPWPPCWIMKWHTHQHGVLRFNCADSLDRTNAATCFAMLPVLQEGLRLLGIQVGTNGTYIMHLNALLTAAFYHLRSWTR